MSEFLFLRGYKNFFIACARISVFEKIEKYFRFFIKCTRISVLREHKLFLGDFCILDIIF